MRIGIYPGSFDPVHKGHITIARETLRQGLCEHVLMVPTGSYWDKTGLTALEHRIRMLKTYEDAFLTVETEYNDTPSTYASFLLFQRRYPEDELCLILGGDNLTQFERWVEYRKLLEYPFVVAARDDFGREQIRQKMREFGKENYAILDIPEMPISSTAIRAAVAARADAGGMLDRPVYDYILKENLYR